MCCIYGELLKVEALKPRLHSIGEDLNFGDFDENKINCARISFGLAKKFLRLMKP
jgi:hypothetical protein